MRPAIGLIAMLSVAGCTLGPGTPKHGPAPLPVAFSETTGSIGSGRGDSSQRWWQAFRDPTLDGFVAEGFGGNLDIVQAKARLRAADSNITVAGAGGLPTLTLGVGQTTTRETGPLKTTLGPVYQTVYGMSANWLIDLFGEVRSQVDSAEAQRDAAVAGVDVARLALLSGLASNYIDARYYQELQSLSERTLATRRRTLELTMQMEREGVSSQLDVSRAMEAVRSVEAQLPGQDASFRQAANRMATLAGRPAGTFLDDLRARRGQPVPAWRAETGVPADLLRNRPDVRKAESDYVSALGDIGFAWSQLFPRITLSGSITPSYVHTGSNGGSLNTWSFGPSLQLPIFEGGRLRANVKVAVARAEEKEAAWKAAVLTAVEDVENALVAYNRAFDTMRALEGRVRSAQRSVDLSNAAYRAGASSLFDTLDAERQLFDAQTSLAEARRNLAQYFVSLNIAVGRGLSGPGRADPARLSAACADPAIKLNRDPSCKNVIDRTGQAVARSINP